MACSLNPQCNFLYGFFKCNPLEDTMGVEVTLRTLKRIHNFRRDHATQSSMCSPWGSLVKPFPLLLRKMEAYMDKRWSIVNPFSPNQRYPDRRDPSSFTKRAIPTKWSRNETKRSHEKHCKSRKMAGGATS